MKRLLAGLLSILMVLSVSVSVVAEETDAIVAMNERTKSTYTSLSNAISSAENGDTITVVANLQLTESLTINKSIILQGETKDITISGLADNPNIMIVVTGENVTIQNLTFKDFGSNCKSSTSGATVIFVSRDATNTTFLAKNLTIDGFCRNAFNFYAGNNTVEDCTITCRNTSSESGYDSKLVKGISAIGSSGNQVTVYVKNTIIAGADSNYANWGAGAVEVWEFADVTVENCTIDSMSYGVVLSDGYENDQKSHVTVKGNKTKIQATEGAVAVQNWNKYVPTSQVIIEDGTFYGYVRLTYSDQKGAAGPYNECNDLQVIGGTYDDFACLKGLKEGSNINLILNTNYQIGASYTVPEGATVNLDLNGRNVTGTSKITNKGTMIVKNTSNTDAEIGGTVTIDSTNGEFTSIGDIIDEDRLTTGGGATIIQLPNANKLEYSSNISDISVREVEIESMLNSLKSIGKATLVNNGYITSEGADVIFVDDTNLNSNLTIHVIVKETDINQEATTLNEIRNYHSIDRNTEILYLDIEVIIKNGDTKEEVKLYKLPEPLTLEVSVKEPQSNTYYAFSKHTGVDGTVSYPRFDGGADGSIIYLSLDRFSTFIIAYGFKSPSSNVKPSTKPSEPIDPCTERIGTGWVYDDEVGHCVYKGSGQTIPNTSVK